MGVSTKSSWRYFKSSWRIIKKTTIRRTSSTVITYRDGELPYFETEKTGVKVHRIDNYMINSINFIDWIMQLNFNMISKATSLINEGEEFDIIHAHDWLTAYAGKSIKEAHKIPLVSTIHATEAGRNGGISTINQKYINDTEWMLTYESNNVIVNSNFMKNEIQRLFGLPFEKIHVVSNGIDLDKFDGIKRDYEFRRNYAKDNEKIIFAIGRLVFEKGIQHLICAMPKILQNYNDVKLVIAGNGSMMEELKKLAYDIGVAEKVYFTGYLAGNNVQKMYKCADIAVFPSTYEPFGIVALEAMLGEVPVVVSDVGGLNEIVEHQKNGIKAYAGNANSIADSVLKLLFDHQLCENIVEDAKKIVIDKYNWNIIAESTLKVYKMAITKEKILIDLQQQKQKKIEEAKITKEEKEENVLKKDIVGLLNLNDRRKLYNM